MYLLFLDESGAHDSASVFVLGGVAVHEHDAWHLQQRLEGSLTYRLAPLGLNATNFELHAKDIKRGVREWKVVPEDLRFKVLGSIYRSIATYTCVDKEFPCALFGAVIDRRYDDFEARAYELVLNKFDLMLEMTYRRMRLRERGMIIHDKRVVDSPLKPTTARPHTPEQRIQAWTRDWQEVAGRVGQLRNLAEVPLFADSKATRLVQAADFVCWGLWRYYGLASRDDRWVRGLWKKFDTANGKMHGLIHVTPEFARRACDCPPCKNRQS